MTSPIGSSSRTPSTLEDKCGERPILDEWKIDLFAVNFHQLCLRIENRFMVSVLPTKETSYSEMGKNYTAFKYEGAQELDTCYTLYNAIKSKKKISGQFATDSLKDIDEMNFFLNDEYQISCLETEISSGEKKISHLEGKLINLKEGFDSVEALYLSQLEEVKEKIQEGFLDQGYRGRIGARWLRRNAEIEEARMDGEKVETAIPEDKREQGFIAYIKPHTEVSSLPIARAYLQGRLIEWRAKGKEMISVHPKQVDKDYRNQKLTKLALEREIADLRASLNVARPHQKKVERNLKKKMIEESTEEELIAQYVIAEKSFIIAHKKIEELASDLEEKIESQRRAIGEEGGLLSEKISSQLIQEKNSFVKQRDQIASRLKKIESTLSSSTEEKKEIFQKIVLDLYRLNPLLEKYDDFIKESVGRSKFEIVRDIEHLIKATQTKLNDAKSEEATIQNQCEEVRLRYLAAANQIAPIFQDYFSQGYSAKILGYWVKREDEIEEAKEFGEEFKRVDPQRMKGNIAMILNRRILGHNDRIHLKQAYLQGRTIEWHKEGEATISLKSDRSEIDKEYRLLLAQRRKSNDQIEKLERLIIKNRENLAEMQREIIEENRRLTFITNNRRRIENLFNSIEDSLKTF